MSADDYAVVVGITSYPFLGDLSGAERDARAFAAWLQQPDGGAVPAQQIQLVLSSDYPPPAQPHAAQPTTAAVEAAFDQLYYLGTQHGGHTGRRLYIYMAGHGFAPELEDAALLMANAARGVTGHHIPGRPYANWFRQAAYFDEVVLFMDCCRESYAGRARRAPPYDVINADQPGRRYYGFATQWSRAAREGAWGPAGEVRGLFTLALLAGLTGAARDDHGAVTGASLEGFVYNYVSGHDSSSVLAEQRPDPEFDYDKRYDVVFLTGVAPPFTLRVTLAAADAGSAVELEDGALEAVPPDASSPTSWEWRLTKGFYRLGLAGRPKQMLELSGEGRTIDVQL
jgi:hypothetical protein